MVLQRDKPISILGKANPGEKVNIGFGLNTFKTTTNADSGWKVQIPAQSAGGPHILKVKGENEIVFNDVYVGEVWIASGQSNMEWKLKEGVKNGQKEISIADFPQIRFIDIKNQPCIKPKADFSSNGWDVYNSQTAPEFSGSELFVCKRAFSKTKRAHRNGIM